MNRPAPQRWAWVDVDLDAIADNVASVAALVAPGRVLAVVKANGYGHGAVPVARAALAAGASALGVALVQEAVELRDAGVDAEIMLLSEQPPELAASIVEHGIVPVVYTGAGFDALAAAAPAGYPVQVKLDTGMRRVGASAREVVDLVRTIEERGLHLAGVFTHLAVADEPDDPYTAGQLAALDRVLDTLADEGVEVPLVHAANSAGALAHPAARRDLVRIGIAMYGIEPGPGVAGWSGDLRPAMSLCARVSHVKRVEAGDRISYGLRHTFTGPATVATIPIGYADGVPRRLSGAGGEVVLHGQRRPIVGVVTMDQLMVDAGELPVEVGDEAVLLGRQGDAEIRAVEWAQRLGTIAYEIVCGISPRVPRRYRSSGQVAEARH